MNDEPLRMPVNVYAIGIDPGKSTGVAVLCNGQLYQCFQGPPHEAISFLTDVADELVGTDVIAACERFTSTERTGRLSSQPTALHVTGAVQVVFYERSIELDLQSPGDAKRMAPNTFLKEYGLYVQAHQVKCPDANDVNDAVRHAVLLIARRRPMTFERLLESRRGESIR